eukprot:31539-Pelagococcus_subviridis.AAC.4
MCDARRTCEGGRAARTRGRANARARDAGAFAEERRTRWAVTHRAVIAVAAICHAFGPRVEGVANARSRVPPRAVVLDARRDATVAPTTMCRSISWNARAGVRPRSSKTRSAATDGKSPCSRGPSHSPTAHAGVGAARTRPATGAPPNDRTLRAGFDARRSFLARAACVDRARLDEI